MAARSHHRLSEDIPRQRSGRAASSPELSGYWREAATFARGSPRLYDVTLAWEADEVMTPDDSLLLPTGEPAWFGEGLRFRCTGCGQCCTGSSGSVNLTRADVARLAEHLGLKPATFTREYTRRHNGRRVLVNRSSGSQCVFLKNNACTVYDARPVQCRTYPWWLANIQDEESWHEAAKSCEGIGHPSAKLVPAAQIIEQCSIDIENDAVIVDERG